MREPSPSMRFVVFVDWGAEHEYKFFATERKPRRFYQECEDNGADVVLASVIGMRVCAAGDE